MRAFVGPCRVGLVSVLLAVLALTAVGSVVLLSPSPVAAQDPEGGGEAPAPGGEVKRGPVNPLVHFFVSIGLVFGLMFAAISVGMVAMIIILLLDLRLSEAVPTAFVDEFTTMVNKRQFKQAFDLCKNDSSFLARVLTAGMGRLQYGIEDAREAMFAQVETVKSSKDSWISYLAAIGTLGPMLGLVGTVSGMIGAFRKLGEATKAPDASELAGEISHALVVTLVGVGISVPAIFFFTFFKNRLNALSHTTTNLADDLLTQMYHNSKKAAGPVATTAGPAGTTAGPTDNKVAATAVQPKP